MAVEVGSGISAVVISVVVVNTVTMVVAVLKGSTLNEWVALSPAVVVALSTAVVEGASVLCVAILLKTEVVGEACVLSGLAPVIYDVTVSDCMTVTVALP